MNNINLVNIDKFKSVFVNINFLTPMSAENMSRNALLAYVLKKGNNTYSTEKEINRKLAHMYNACMDISTDKFRDYLNLKVDFEYINSGRIDFSDVVEFLVDYITNPNFVDGVFPKDIVEREKQALIERIESEKDNKKKYAIENVNKMMFEGEDYACSVLGNIEVIQNISAEELTHYYKELMKNSEIVINLVGGIKGHEELAEQLYTDLLIIFKKDVPGTLKCEIDKYTVPSTVKEKTETQSISQSVVAIGAKICGVTKDDAYKIMVYNELLGGNPASLMFQNVREKNSLAYFAKSMYNRQRQTINIFAGIEPKNYEKAKAIMLEQLEIMKNGKFSDVQFTASVDTLVSTLVAIYDSKEELSRMLFANELFFGRKVTIEEMVENIREVTKEDVMSVASRVYTDSIFCLGGKQSE